MIALLLALVFSETARAIRVISVRLSPDVLEPFRITGDGWQTRIGHQDTQHGALLALVGRVAHGSTMKDNMMNLEMSDFRAQQKSRCLGGLSDNAKYFNSWRKGCPPHYCCT